MQEIARVTLGNEMDLILAHKRSMKLAEVAGLSLSAQTTFATAVSEVARITIESGKRGCLILSVEMEHRDKYIVACFNNEFSSDISQAGLEYAKRLVNKYQISTTDNETSIELFYFVAPTFRIDIHKLDEWRSLFRNEPPISPYEELKRKNEQLQELSQKVQKSEGQYKTLTNSLPLIIFSLDINGKLLYANEWLAKYSGETVESLNRTRWKNFVYEEDYAAFSLLLNNSIADGAINIKLQSRFKVKGSGEYLWHQVSLTPFKDDEDELQYWIGYMVDIHAQKIVEETLKDNIELKQVQARLKESQQEQEKYIGELNRSNEELQQFAFVASHDLQEPVRKLIYYSDFLLKDNNVATSVRANEYLSKIHSSAQRMRTLIKDLLVFSQIKKDEIKFVPIDLDKLAQQTRLDFEITIAEKGAVLTANPLPMVNGDQRMMEQLFANLVSNALKYSKKDTPPQITISCEQKEDSLQLMFEDNGIGFDEKYLPQMFTLFQRLHDRNNYEGTGLGLAICKKIVDIHHGKIWASGREGEGSTFYVSLPLHNVQ